MSTKPAAVTVGLVPQGGADWIAGVVYLDNIVRAVLALGAARVNVSFVAGPYERVDSGSSVTLGVPVHYYTHRSRDSWSQAAWGSVKARRLPRSLETVASRAGLSVLFPLQTPPSERLPVPWIGWIPDFQHKRRPEFFSVAARSERDSRFRRIVDEAPHVVVSSQDARADLMRWFPMSDDRVSVLRFRTALDPRWIDVNPRMVVRQFDLPSKFLCYPSQFWVHKNHRTVFAALNLLRNRGRTDIVLVCTGREYDHRHPEYADAIKEEIARRGLQAQVRLLGLLDRATQIQIVRASAAIVQASHFEGWSALIEDSRALGKRIFVSDIPVHREQEPDDAVYFNPESAEALADLIERDWPHLESGPDPVREQRAGEQQQRLTHDFACHFTDIVRRVSLAT